MAPRRDHRTLDLLAWEPRSPVPEVAEDTVMAATLRGRICRLMALSIKECGKDRGTIAAEMSDYLGEPVSKDVLDKYISESSSDHNISIIRYLALVHATDDMRLLQGLSDPFEHSVIPDRFVPAIRESMIRDRIETLEHELVAAKRAWKGPRS